MFCLSRGLEKSFLKATSNVLYYVCFTHFCLQILKIEACNKFKTNLNRGTPSLYT